MNQPYKTAIKSACGARFKSLSVLIAGAVLLVSCLTGVGFSRADTVVPGWMPNIREYKELPMGRFKGRYGKDDFIRVFFVEKDSTRSGFNQLCAVKIDAGNASCDNDFPYGGMIEYTDDMSFDESSEKIPGFPADLYKPVLPYTPGQQVDFSQGSLRYRWFERGSFIPVDPDPHDPPGPINLGEKTFTAYKDIACFEGPDYRFAGCMIGDHGFLINPTTIRTY